MNKKPILLEFEKPIKLLEEQLEALRESSGFSKVDVSDEIRSMEAKLEETKNEVYKHLTPWQRVQIARHPDRPYSLDFIGALFEDFQELHGDRCHRDDQALIGGTAVFKGQPVMIIAQQKGRNTRENIKRNFGCPNPEGYRKAHRLLLLAEKFNLPVICLIDTAGAYPGLESEERHVAEAIAVNIRDMSNLKVPIVAVVIGEGGSGGALGIGVADTVGIFENAYYSVISPEGCAAILWKDRTYAADAARELKITADKLISLGIVDTILREAQGGAHKDVEVSIKSLEAFLEKELKVLAKKKLQDLLNQRYEKYRAMGKFEQVAYSEDAKGLRVI